MATRAKREVSLGTQNDTLGTETDQEAANRLFLQRVELLPGILRVEQHVDTISGQRSFRVYVRYGDRDAQYTVYHLEAEIYQLHPRAYLDVWVLTEQDATMAPPGPPVPGP